MGVDAILFRTIPATSKIQRRNHGLSNVMKFAVPFCKYRKISHLDLAVSRYVDGV